MTRRSAAVLLNVNSPYSGNVALTVKRNEGGEVDTLEPDLSRLTGCEQVRFLVV